MTINFTQLKRLIYCTSLIFLLSACSDTKESVRTPALEIYQAGMMAFDDELYQEAEDKFKKVTEEHPGTQLATLAYLKMGDLNFRRNRWIEAESGYRMFLTLNPNSHLTPYVLHQLISLNYQRNFTGVFFREREYDRDMEPNRRLIQDYQRFFLLYPNNIYLKDVYAYLLKSRADLAEYEFLVGNFYFKNEAYHSAIHRYRYLLKYFPEYPRYDEVAQKLIEAYYKNQQPHLAREMENVLKHHKQENHTQS
ncbi:MAG: outer membrane protein assembly factor BamD [SAR324 cluster bacterium]|nr:outer membrane protein assembly factor BamD [SAR324 cluster bacterium]